MSKKNRPTTNAPPAKHDRPWSAQALGGARARLTIDDPQQSIIGALLILPQPDDDITWRNLDLDSKTLDRMPTPELLARLTNLSPDLSKALWDFLRFTNPGYEIKVMRPGSEEVDARGQAALEDFLKELRTRYGAFDVIIHRLFMNLFMRGSLFCELVLNKSGTMPLDLVAPDSRWIFFDRQPDPEIGQQWRPYQYQLGVKIYLDRDTIRYVPVDPLPGSPYGRAPAAPALFPILFTLGLLHDLRRVVSQQGYPRLDISINLERLLKSMPSSAAADTRERERWLESTIRGVSDAYAMLQPDDAYIHTDVTTVNGPVGTVDSASLGAIDGLMAMLDRQAMRALKTTPLLFGMNDTSNEAQANRSWEIFVAGIKALQHLTESLLEHMFGIALQVQGIQSVVEFRFGEIRAAELMRDAQTLTINLQNAAMAYDRGFVSQDEAAHMAMGKDKADQPEPRKAINPPTPVAAPINPAAVAADPGSARALIVDLPTLLGNGKEGLP